MINNKNEKETMSKTFLVKMVQKVLKTKVPS